MYEQMKYNEVFYGLLFEFRIYVEFIFKDIDLTLMHLDKVNKFLEKLKY